MTTSRLLQRSRRTLRHHRARRNLLLEPLESRRVLATIPVTTFEDVVVADEFTSLREAITQADDNGEADTIVLPQGTYTLALGELVIDDAGALEIASNGEQATIDAQDASRVFWIKAGSDVTLNGLVITGGYSAENGGGIINHGTLTIEDSTIQGNRADWNGGGLENTAGATITNTLFQDNHASGFGGGFRNLGVEGGAGNMVITGCTFLENSSGNNGGAFDNNGVLVVSGSQFGPTEGEIGGNYAGGLGSAKSATAAS